MSHRRSASSFSMIISPFIIVVVSTLLFSPTSAELQPVPCTPLRRLSAGTGLTCAIQHDSDLKLCFGQDTRASECPGIEKMHSEEEAANVAHPRFQQISAAVNHACAVTLWNSIRCWGAGAVAETIPGYFSSISTSRYVNCAVGLEDSFLTCWGDTTLGAALIASAPRSIPIRQVHLGRLYGCAVRLNDSLPMCWPPGSSGPPSEPMSMVRAGVNFACGLNALGRLLCWTNDGSDATNEIVIAANKLSTVEFLQIAVGTDFGCGIEANTRAVHCFAREGHAIFQEKPDLSTKFIGVVAGGEHACAIRTNYTVACWPSTAKYGAARVPDGLLLCPAGDYDPELQDNGDLELAANNGNPYTRGDMAMGVIFSIIGGIILDRFIQSRLFRALLGRLCALKAAAAASSVGGGVGGGSGGGKKMKFPSQHPEDEDDDIPMREDL